MTVLPEAYLRFRHEFIALDPDRYPADYIDAQVFAGFWRCWGTDKAAILAELKQYPSGVLEVHGLAAAGDLETILELIPVAEQWGRDCGCTRAVIESREGWQKLMQPRGYELHQICLRKAL